MVVCGICNLNCVDLGSTLIHMNKAHQQSSPLCSGCAEPRYTIINENFGCKTCINNGVKWQGNIENLETGKKVLPSGSETEKGLLEDDDFIFQTKNKNNPILERWEGENILRKSLQQAGEWVSEAVGSELGECSMGPPDKKYSVNKMSTMVNNPGYAQDWVDWGSDDGYQWMQGGALGGYQRMSNLNYPQQVEGRPRLASPEPRREQGRVQCTHCPKNYADQTGLRIHEKAAHQNFHIVCPLCGLSFKYQASFSRHKKEKHPMDLRREVPPETTEL